MKTQAPMKIEFYRHSLEPEDIEKAKEVLNSLFLTTGSVTAEFEQKFSEITGVPYVVGLNSCTAALHLALLTLGVGPGDEVITTPMTFLATATAILHTGAKPVFVDVEPQTGLINPSLIKAAITKKTKAILPVHLYGTMADMKAIQAVAQEHGLGIVEDSAHCIEGERDGVRPGELGDIACYSFYATKNLTSGEGGAVATKNKKWAERIRLLRLHGMNTDAVTRYGSPYKHWDMEVLGWKYNMDNIHASLLVHQVERIDKNWKRRAQIAETYRTYLSSLPSLELPAIKGKSAHHLQTVWVPTDRRDQVLRQMTGRGIGVTVNYRALHTLRYFRETFGFSPSDFPVAYEIGQRTLSIPLYPKMTDAEVDYVVDSLTEIVSPYGDSR